MIIYFFGMQILSPDVGRYWRYPKSLFRTSLTSYPDFWYNRELHSFLKDYSVFSWGRASSSRISAMLTRQKWPIILLTVETSAWKLWEISLNWPTVEPAVIGMTVEFWNLVQGLASNQSARSPGIWSGDSWSSNGNRSQVGLENRSLLSNPLSLNPWFTIAIWLWISCTMFPGK